MNEVQKISQDDLIKGRWYIGRGRNSNIGQWNGKSFIVLAECMVYTGSVATVTESRPCIKFEPYFTENGGCFQPFKLIDEGEIIDFFENNGIYGAKIKFK